jgi:glyoxylase-like metal-dependent hydrolase (beta-lactamase superfamily II)
MNAKTHKIGDFDVTALSDGVLATSLDVVTGVDKAESQRLAGLKAGDAVKIDVNAFLLRRNGRYALVDAGSGNTMGPTLGKLLDSLRAAGVAPETIETIFLTHLHPDHSNGLTDDSGRAVFPNAELVLHEQEAAFWIDRDHSGSADERLRRNGAKARETTGAYRPRIRRVREGEAAPGVSAVHLPGHTPGHTGWLIQSGRDGLLIWGDMVHIASIQIARPDAGLVFDIDSATACVSRRKIFDRVAADKLRVGGAHLDFPGFGYISRKGAEYRFDTDA